MIKLCAFITFAIGSVLAGGEINCAAAVPRNAADLLCTAGWRTIGELDNMSGEDKRNTIIVELAKRTSDSVNFYQGQGTDSLIGIANLYLQLRQNGWRSEGSMRGMSHDDLRNTCIVELEKKGYGGISDLQGQNNMDLADKAANYLSRSRGVAEVVGMQFHINSASFSQRKPQVLASGIYDNSNSGQKLFQTFRSSETFTEKESLSYSRESSSSYSLAVGINFKMSSVLVEATQSNTFTITLGNKETMNTAQERTHQKNFSIESRVEVDPYKKIKKEFVVNVANVDVPFTMTIRTNNGELKQVRGTYHGVKAFNEHVTQRNLS